MAGSASNHLSMPPSPSPNWYADNSDNFDQNRNIHQRSVHTSLPVAPQTPSTHHPSTAPQISVSAAPQAQGTLTQPAAIILATKGEKKALDSSCIDKFKLIPVDMVVAKYPKLRTVSKASTLAVKLPKESVFGEDAMRQCTVHGTRQLPRASRKRTFPP